MGIFIKSNKNPNSMLRLIHTFFVISASFCLVYSQVDEIWLDSETKSFSDSLTQNFYTPTQVEQYINSLPRKPDEIILGGYTGSIFHESVDSVKIVVKIDNIIYDSVFTHDGLFSISLPEKGNLIDLSIAHPDYHQKDTSFLFPEQKITILNLILQPKYKILLRGRVYAGNMPLEGVNVEINHAGSVYKLTTRGCYYDKEDYWNCLFDGMFKLNLTTENPEDSVLIKLSKGGMKSRTIGMKINEYSGEIMYLRMKYESSLPVVPLNGLDFRLSFPLLSSDKDWFVSLSYYRLINTRVFRRLAYGIDANMYVTTVSVTHETFRGLEPSTVDSSYINAFAGPSVLVWLVPPEIRTFSSYAGCTFAYHFQNSELVFQPFIGTRLFLDMNKAISLEIRYCEYKANIVHYVFNPYGSAFHYKVESTFEKLHVNLGIQIVF
jgi:hypothetical protein